MFSKDMYIYFTCVCSQSKFFSELITKHLAYTISVAHVEKQEYCELQVLLLYLFCEIIIIYCTNTYVTYIRTYIHTYIHVHVCTNLATEEEMYLGHV